MTKIKKGLLAVLLCVMAIALGAVSLITFSSAKADDGDATVTNVQKFKNYIDVFSGEDAPELTKAALLPEWDEDNESESEYNTKLEGLKVYWSAYKDAYNTYQLLLSDTEQKELAGTAYQSTYETLNTVFGTLQTIVATDGSDMYFIAHPDANHPLTYDNAKKVDDLLAQYEALTVAEKAYVDFLTTGFKNTKSAKDTMDGLSKSIEDAIAAIKAIEYYDSDASDMAVYDADKVNADTPTQWIVLDSEETIEAAEDALNAVSDLSKAASSDVYYGIATVGGNIKSTTDFKYVVETTGEGDDATTIDYIEIYNNAVKALAAQKDKVFDSKKGVNVLLAAAYEAIEAGSATAPGKYYTLPELGTALSAYEALKDTTNHNDLQGLVEETDYNTTLTYKDLYDKMSGVVAKLNATAGEGEDAPVGSIAEIVAKIDEKIPATTDNKYTYNTAFRDALDDVADALSEFYTVDTDWYGDIQAHDQKVFDGELDEAYIISNYAKYAQACVDYDTWGKVVEELIEQVRIMVYGFNAEAEIEGTNVKEIVVALSSYFTNENHGGLDQGAYEVLSTTQIAYDAANKAAIRITNDTTTEDDWDIRTTADWVSAIWASVSSVLTLVNNLDNNIATLYNNTHGENPIMSLYAQRDALAELVDEFNNLPDGQQLYISAVSRGYLTTMQDEVEAAKAALTAWRAAVNAIADTVEINTIKIAEIKTVNDKLVITTTTEDGVVHITYVEVDVLSADQWAAIEEAQAKFAALNSLKAEDGTALNAGVWKYLIDLTYDADDEDADEEDVANYNAYHKYLPLAEGQETLADYIENLAALMGDINTTDLDKLGLNEDGNLTDDGMKEILAWSSAVSLIREAYEKLGDTATDSEYYSKDAQATLQSKYDTEYANYEKALEYFFAYRVEGLIYELPEAADVKLTDKKVIEAAKEAYDDYLEDGGNMPVRNLTKLNADIKALADLSGALDAWIAKVIKLIDSKYDATDKDITALEADLAAAVTGFDGYPLDLTAYAAIKTAYEEVLDEVGDGAEDYLKTAYAQYVAIGTKSDEAIDELQDDINELIKKNNSDDGLTKEDYVAVKSVQTRYDAFHKTQQDEITGYDESFTDVVDKIVAADIFNDMVEKLYYEVFDKVDEDGNVLSTGGNITSLVPVVAEAIKCIYTNAEPELKKLYDATWALTTDEDGNTPLDRVLAAYNKAVEDGTALRLVDVQKALEELDLDGISGEIDSKIAAAIAKVEDAYQAAIEAAVDGIVGEDGSIEVAVNAAKAELEKAIADAKTELNNAITSATDALKEELQGNIDDLEEALTALINAEAGLREAGDKKNEEAIATLKTNLEKAIADAKAALEGSIAEVANALKSTDANVAQAQTDIKALQDSLKALQDKDADLQEQIDSLSGTITGLTVGIIIVAIVTAAALAGVIVLFIKKKN